MKKIAAIGAGNVGIMAAKALELSPDMEFCGFVRKNIKPVPGFEKMPVAKNVFELPEKPDGAIICVPSKMVEETEKELLEAGIHTVDAFDIHEEIRDLRKKLSAAAIKGNSAAIIGAGWDPGLDSVIRTLMLSALPTGIMYTNFGPGMSMGHSVAARMVDGVADAISYTLPLGYGKHRRKIYVVLKPDADKNAVEHGIFCDGYFEHDECSIEFVDSAEPFFETGHRAKISRFGNACGIGGNSLEFYLSANNPAITAQLLVSAMRAAFLQKSGAYFMPEIPPCDFCIGGEWQKFI